MMARGKSITDSERQVVFLAHVDIPYTDISITFSTRIYLTSGFNYSGVLTLYLICPMRVISS